MEISVTVNMNDEIWGNGDERLDGVVWCSNGEFHYSTYRGVTGVSVFLGTAIDTVARQLGYTGAVCIVDGA
jgi:hypothetical protein